MESKGNGSGLPPPQYEAPAGVHQGQGYQQQSYGAGGGYPPSYPQPSGGGNIIVTTPQYSGPQTVVMQSQIKPSNYLGLAIFACLCFNPCLGLIAIIMAVMSDSAFGEGNIDSARQYGKIAMILSVVSIILGVIGLIIFFAVFFTSLNRIVNTCYSSYSETFCDSLTGCYYSNGYCHSL